MKLTLAQYRDLAVKHGFPDPDLAAAVAYAESAGHTDARNIVTQDQADAYNANHPEGPKHYPERSFGSFQVSTLAWPKYDEAQLLNDVDYNFDAAFEISSGGTDWHFWSGYKYGGYKQYMPGGSAPATSPASSASSSNAVDVFVLAVAAAALAYIATRKLKVPA